MGSGEDRQAARGSLPGGGKGGGCAAVRRKVVERILLALLMLRDQRWKCAPQPAPTFAPGPRAGLRVTGVAKILLPITGCCAFWLLAPSTALVVVAERGASITGRGWATWGEGWGCATGRAAVSWLLVVGAGGSSTHCTASYCVASGVRE